MNTATETSLSAVAFNAGSDARLAGLPLAANPYPASGHRGEAWAHGWRSVDRAWGRDAKWPVKPLPPVGAG